MIDPKLTLLELLKNGWSLSFEPVFSSDWLMEKAEFPQLVVSHIITTKTPLGLSENPAIADYRYTGIYLVDVWSSGEQDKRWMMIEEVNRILQSHHNSPGETLESVRVSDWRDLDEGTLRPPLYRSQTRVEVSYIG